MTDVFTSSTGIAFDISGVTSKKLLHALVSFLSGSNFEHQLFLKRLKELPKSVKKVFITEDTSINSWSNQDISKAKNPKELHILANPNYKSGYTNPGRTLHHEISHSSLVENRKTLAEAEEFMRNNTSLMDEANKSTGDKERARMAVIHAHEERSIAKSDDIFGRAIHEHGKKPPSIIAGINSWLTANKHAKLKNKPVSGSGNRANKPRSSNSKQSSMPQNER